MSVLPQFAGIRPRAVVRCREAADVTAALALGDRVVVRGGGHCFAGRSSTEGTVIDLSPLDGVSVGAGVAHIGGGARLGAVYDALSAHDLAIAAGCGPTVGIGGLALGGGLGILGRRYGLTSDQVVAAQVVLADGTVVECDEHQEPDLFWALRGAGGGQFGVVTRLTLRTVPAPATTTLHLRWPHQAAAAVIDAWQAWAPDAPDELAASLLVTAGPRPAEPPVVHVFGAMLGSRAEAAALLAALPDPSTAKLHEWPFRDAKRHLAEHGPGEGAAPDAHVFGKSEFFRQALPAAVVADLLANLAADRVDGQVRVLDFSPWGGAYNRVPEAATAFAHRAERFLLKHDVLVPDAGGETQARQWLRRSWSIVHPWAAGRVYPNFPDPDLEDWPTAYHGDNLDRLRRVKAAYDPGHVFRFPQSL